MSRFYENIQIINMLNKDSHESDEPEINSLSDEEEHVSVCSEISDTVSSTEVVENEEYGNKPEKSNVFVSRDGTQWNKISFLITKTKVSNIVKTKCQKLCYHRKMHQLHIKSTQHLNSTPKFSSLLKLDS